MASRFEPLSDPAASDGGAGFLETSEVLQSLKGLKCSFPNKLGDPIVSFDKIDTDEGTAEISGFFRRRGENVNVKLVGFEPALSQYRA